jgi:hypothetical protein
MRGVKGAMGACGCSSDTVNLAARLVMAAAPARTESGRAETGKEDEPSAWALVLSAAREEELADAVIAGTPGENRLSRGALLWPASFAASL